MKKYLFLLVFLCLFFSKACGFDVFFESNGYEELKNSSKFVEAVKLGDNSTVRNLILALFQ